MRSHLLALVLALASTQLVACVAGDNDSPADEDQFGDTNIDIEQGGMMGGQLARESDIGMEAGAAIAQALGHDTSGIDMEAGAALARALGGVDGATLVDGSSVTAQNDGRIVTNGVVNTTQRAPQTRIGGEQIEPKLVDGDRNVAGRKDNAHLGL